jgi:serine/threonine protein kinase/dienelactone hydrolase
MSDSRWQRVEEIFHEAAELAPEARSAFLDQVCAGDQPLRKEVESLLAHDAEDGSTLANAIADAAGNTVAAELAPGDTLAHYRIVEKIGAGGMGVVYRARDEHLARDVAIKVLPPGTLVDESARKHFHKEALILSQLNHPNIATIHDFDTQQGVDFLVMEYIPGITLSEEVAAGPLPEKEVLRLGVQLAEGLAAAHDHGVVHRDLKPGNLRVSSDGRLKILDFGLAKLRLPVAEGAPTESLTETLAMAGTPPYMAPEQLLGAEIDARTDIHAAGSVLYEMATGQRPFAEVERSQLIGAILHRPPRPPTALNPRLSPELERIIGKCLEKNPEQRYQSGAELHRDLVACQDRFAARDIALLSVLRKPRFAIPAAALLLILCVAGAWFIHRQSKIRWAKERAIPEIERLIISTEPGFVNLTKAYKLALEAERYVPDDPALVTAMERCSMRISIRTEPPGAAVHRSELFAADQQWQPFGVTPIEKVRVPAGLFWWKFEKQGYETVLAMAPTFRIDEKFRDRRSPYNISRIVDPKGKLPAGMARVLGAETDIGQLEDFFVDRYEVTNKQYKEFVDSGGYRERKYWKHPFVKPGKNLSWEEAMAEFRDQTGRPGPATWQAGDYPKGQADYPVAGVSWYEAAAYAEYAGKSLPTLRHWGFAAGESAPLWGGAYGGWLGFVSNLKGEGPAPVGSYRSMTAYGAFDMAGNVREWCWNEAKDGRVIRGGAWNDATYMATYVSQAPAFDRSPRNGFRCVVYPNPGKIPAKAFEPYVVEVTEFPDFVKQKPVPDSVFEVYRDLYSYDRTELNPRVEWRNDSSADWIQERVIVDAAYGNEKLPMYLFLPKGTPPPYQTVIYVPGSGSTQQPSSKDMDSYYEFDAFLSSIVKNGRAVLYPIYKGTFERGDTALASINTGAPTRQYTEYLTQLVKDFRRSIDYLETRPDIDSGKLAYLGFSWGARVAPFILGVEPRLRASVLVSGGMRQRERPEAQQINFVTRVKIPTLLLNGRFDMVYPFEASAALFNLLGTPAEHKRQIVYDTDHYVPRNEFVKETLAWLDRYLGPVK